MVFHHLIVIFLFIDFFCCCCGPCLVVLRRSCVGVWTRYFSMCNLCSNMINCLSQFHNLSWVGRAVWLCCLHFGVGLFWEMNSDGLIIFINFFRLPPSFHWFAEQMILWLSLSLSLSGSRLMKKSIYCSLNVIGLPFPLTPEWAITWASGPPQNTLQEYSLAYYKTSIGMLSAW